MGLSSTSTDVQFGEDMMNCGPLTATQEDVPRQTPVWQVSDLVQGCPSVQAVPSGANWQPVVTLRENDPVAVPVPLILIR